MRILPLVLLALALVGCRDSAPAAASTATQTPAWTQVKSKLEGMTPEQRAQYIREHPDEIASLGQIPTPPTAGTPQ